MDHALGAVDDGQRPLRAGVGQQRGKWLPGAEHVGQLADCQQPGARADQLQRDFKINQASAVQG
ncbi:hypothetical protein D3C77_740760 [compost metagenome]